MKSTFATSVNVSSIPAAYIMSHSTFNFGQQLSQSNITRQVLLLYELTKSTILRIEFLYIDIGCTNNYNNDAGYIQSIRTEPRFTFTCNNLTSDIIVSPGDSARSYYVGFAFEISNDTRRGGFLLKYSGM